MNLILLCLAYAGLCGVVACYADKKGKHGMLLFLFSFLFTPLVGYLIVWLGERD